MRHVYKLFFRGTGGGTEEVSSFVKNSQLVQLERYISLEQTDKESCIGHMVGWLLLVLFFCNQTEGIAHIEQRRKPRMKRKLGVHSAQIKIVGCAATWMVWFKIFKLYESDQLHLRTLASLNATMSVTG